MAERRYHTGYSAIAVLETCKTSVGMRDGCRLCYFTSNTAHLQRGKGIHKSRLWRSGYIFICIETFN